MKPQFNPNKFGSGDLKTPVTFFQYGPDDSPFPGESELKPVFACYAEVYNVSMKDLEIMKEMNVKRSVTIRIRDTNGEYFPSNKDYVAINDFRYMSTVNGVTKPIRFNVIDIRPDIETNAITVLLAVTE